MRLSERTRTAVYKAIHDAVMNTRIALNRDGLSTQHDAKIAQVETVIYRDVLKALKVADPEDRPHE